MNIFLTLKKFICILMVVLLSEFGPCKVSHFSQVVARTLRAKFDRHHFYYLCEILISILGIDFHLHTVYNSIKYSCFTEIDIDPPPSHRKCL